MSASPIRLLFRIQLFVRTPSTNARYRCLEWDILRLAKVEKELEGKLKKEARRYNKNYQGQMIHMDTKLLPLLEGENPTKAREYLFVAIDDFSRELFSSDNAG